MARRIAVDMDNTLVEVQEAFLERYNADEGTAYTREDIAPWDFDKTPVTYDKFHAVTQGLWAEEYESLEPMEPRLDTKLDRLNAYGAVDIVTGREDREAEMRSWLRGENIYRGRQYGRFVVEQDKAGLGYDLYVDDNPLLAWLAPTWHPPRLYTDDVQAVGCGPFDELLAYLDEKDW